MEGDFIKYSISVVTIIILSVICCSCSVLGIMFSDKKNIYVQRYNKELFPTQDAITAAFEDLRNQNGGTLVLQRNAVYHIKPAIAHLYELPSNTIIEGNGATIIIEEGSNSASYTWDCIFYAENKTNITIRNLTLDSNGGQNPVLQKSVPNAASRHNGLFSALYTNNVNIEKCIVKNVAGYGCLYLGYCDNVCVKECEFYNIGVEKSTPYIGDASVLMGVGKNWIIEDNYLKNDYLSNCGTGLDLACSESIVRNNHVESFWAGINLANNGATDSHDVLVSNNKLLNNGTGIYLWSSTTPYKGDCYNHTIINNLVQWHAREKGWGSRGIDLSMCVYGEVRGIQILKNIFKSVPEEGVFPNSYEIAINMNLLKTKDDGTPNNHNSIDSVEVCNNTFEGVSGAAIQIGNNVDNVKVEGNLFEDCAYAKVDYSYNSSIVYTRSSELHNKCNLRIISNRFIHKTGLESKSAIYLLNAPEDIVESNNQSNIKLLRRN